MKGLISKNKEKNKVIYDSFDYFLFVIILVLLGFGLIMVYSAGFYKAITAESNSMYYFIRQGIFGVLGIIGMLIVSKIEYHKYIRLRWLGLIVSAILLGITIAKIPGITHSANGATRWIKVGSLTFQPSEFVKYAAVLFLAVELSLKGNKIKSFKKGVLPALSVVAIFAGLVLWQRNMSIACVIFAVGFIMIFAAGARLKHIGILSGVGIALVTIGISMASFRSDRIKNFLNPWADATGKGYQVIQSFYALGSGGILGLGLGQSRQKTMYMPEPHNDFIFAIIGEELGLVGCLFVISLFVLFICRGVYISIHAKDIYGTLLALGITCVIAIQAIINIAVVTGSMPVTGVPLPFISYGGTALFVNLLAMGVLLNISRHSQKTI